MKTIAVSLLLGAGALSMTVPASAGVSHSKGATVASTAFAQVDMSSRHRHYSDRHYRVSRVAIGPRSFRPVLPLTPLTAAPYVVTYRTYGRARGAPAAYVVAGPGAYAYGPYPFSDTYGYAPVRLAPGVLYDTNAVIAPGGIAPGFVGFGVPGTTW